MKALNLKASPEGISTDPRRAEPVREAAKLRCPFGAPKALYYIPRSLKAIFGGTQVKEVPFRIT